MNYISRDQFDSIIRDKYKISAEDLVYVLEEKLGYTVSIEKKSSITNERRKRMTDFIFSNEDVLNQLRQASKNQEYIVDDAEALKIIREAEDEG